MEDNIQTIIITLIAIVVFFIFPTYVAYEKKDDLSYSMALKYTQNFVDNVRSKGYVSKAIYDDYVTDLAKTGNTYDINLEHIRKKIEPVSNYFKVIDGKDKLVDFTNQENIAYLEAIKTSEGGYIQNTYRVDEEIISGKQVIAIMENEDFYQMNVGDEFTVILKNTNTTFATIFYNIITIGKSDTNTRIYVNYGGSVTNETWTKSKIYKEYLLPTTPIGTIEEILTDATSTTTPTDIFMVTDPVTHKSFGAATSKYDTNFVIEFEADPKAVTELPTVGYPATEGTTTKLYNFLIKDVPGISNTEAGVGVTVGKNGLAIILKSINGYSYSALTYNVEIKNYTKFKIVFRNNKPTLYVNDIQTLEGILPPTTVSNIISKVFTTSRIEQGTSINQQYIGNARNIKLYKINI